MGQKSTISDPLFLHSEIENTAAKTETGYESLVHTSPDGEQRLSVLISGATCGLCIQKIESALAAQDGVTKAYLNFSEKRLSMSWNGTKDRANEFVQIIENLGYGVQPYDEKSSHNQRKSEERFLLLCLGVAGFAMGNIMLLSVGVWSADEGTMGMATRDLMHWISAMIALPTILFSGRPFFRSAINVLKKGHTNMDVPISLALILASGASLFETINHGPHVYFDSAVMLAFFLLIGRYLDFKARASARSSAHDLLQSFQGFATIIDQQGQTKRLLIRDLKAGMIVRVAAGEAFPIDGHVQTGSSTVDTSLVTGETLPREISAGDMVYAGTINMAAPVTCEVAKAADDSLLADIVRLMDQAGQAQAAYVRIADKAAKLYTPIVHFMALATFIGWVTLGGAPWQDALMVAVTVLIITCPCALGLAVPVVQVLATSKLMKRGILVKSGDALERLAAIDTAIFDKTGTLTVGKPELITVPSPSDLRLAASIAFHSAHPLSQAVVSAHNGKIDPIDNIQEHEGQGLSGLYNGQEIKLGSRNFCGDENAAPAKGPEIWLSKSGAAAVQFEFEDLLRPDAKAMIENLHAHHINTHLVSGDRMSVAQKIANDIGITSVHGEKTPLEKFEILEGLQADGHKVLMVGDGLNDAPVLAAANISMAPGAAIDMAQNAADIIFMGKGISPIYDTYQIAVKTQNLVKQNFVLAVLYNMIAIPMAVAGMVTPFIAALAMSGSSLLVIANSFRLKFKL